MPALRTQWEPSWIQAPGVNWDQTIPFARHRADCGSRKRWTSRNRESRSGINKSIKADAYHTNNIKGLEKAPDFPVVLGRAMAQLTNRSEELLSQGKDIAVEAQNTAGKLLSLQSDSLEQFSTEKGSLLDAL